MFAWGCSESRASLVKASYDVFDKLKSYIWKYKY